MTDQIVPTLNRLKKNFRTGKTRPVEWRKQQLRNLERGIKEMTMKITGAQQADLGLASFSTEFTSIYTVLFDIEYNLEHIDTFIKDVQLDHPLMFAPGKSRIKYEPLGVVLIYGSWNYPFVVTLKPLIQAITTGNAAVIKPSEMAPASSAIIKQIVDTYLDTDFFSVIEGGPEVAAAIGNHPWDLICFTGSTMKGKLVAEAAAKNLIPCIMELGGKCPAIIDESANIDLAASKVCNARFGNSGQTCISTDYVIVHESIKQQFIDRLVATLKTMFGDSPTGSPEMGKVITDWHCDRIMDLVNNSKGKVITGGRADRKIKFVEPTIVVDPDRKSTLMTEEIFGPVLPIISFSHINQVIDHINDGDKPLAVYYFGTVRNNPNKERVEVETSSGAFVTNDVMVQMVNHEFGFGGVGPSGYGRYGGWEGYKQWTNPKSVMIKPSLNMYPANQLSPPWTPEKQALIRRLLKTKGTQQGLLNKIYLFLLLVLAVVVYLKWTTMVVEPVHGLCKRMFD